MGKVTIFLMAISTVILLITFGQAVSVLRGGSVESHFGWAMAALISVLAANFFAMFHAAQSDRLIRSLRARVEALEGHNGPDESPPPQ